MYRCQSAWKLLELNDRYRIFHQFHPSTVVDLAAAPGGFAQAALELMHIQETARPSSLPPMVIAVDQRPIDPMPGLLAVRGNILQHQRILQAVQGVFSHMRAPTASPSRLSSSTQTVPLARSVDMVLHDGVSVVKGQRAFSVTYAQNQMALSALLLAGKLFRRFGPMPDLPAEAEKHPSNKRDERISHRTSAPRSSPAVLPVCFVSKVLHCHHFGQVLRATRALFRHVKTSKLLASRSESLERYVVATDFQLAAWQRLTTAHVPTWPQNLQRHREQSRSTASASLFSMPPAPEDCGDVHHIVWNCLGCGRTCTGCQPCMQCGPYQPVVDARL
ncbi:conserved hypothetical protein [Leishmania braziliensis MHOM/BR/75/M2904]|uniref:Ribosomal RNA methyltransferase FtsJ domain-containing protein n=2 Tax=Leishmania braziliensis TaxID=5660 RepID=E9AIU3_LEIBR|nr:conserved hypothetical protein [Leishmania braziliensis MHOM/BR/75/M2904]CAJ2477742.1 unnamed protein product [Leishmania braziliensis]CAJ2478204.1 unnamed protein product [Leishmania braziliensis]CBZ14784.1 conserved hypothetical protein [Leishmania braziliensis MHOM/BR/75/M2904]SYZ68263.1 FtsJ-like_methyltransferase [Leishmania braziliensis MHOM/BR/75/M2904]